MYTVKLVYVNRYQIEYYVLNTKTMQVQSVWRSLTKAQHTCNMLNRGN